MNYGKLSYDTYDGRESQSIAVEAPHKKDFDILKDKLLQVVNNSEALTKRLYMVDIRFYGPKPSKPSTIEKIVGKSSESVLHNLHNVIDDILAELDNQHSIVSELEKL